MEAIQQFVEGVSPLWQWLAVMAIGAIPYIESYGGAAIGILAGVSAPIAIAAAIVGNWLSMFAMVTFGNRIYKWRGVSDKPPSVRVQKFKRAFDKYGIAGVSIIGQTILPSQVTSMAMVTFGANKGAVIFWQTVSIVLWGVVLGVATMFSAQVIAGV